MIIKVFGYLEKLFQIVQPQKLLFMAIDGVPPSCLQLLWEIVSWSRLQRLLPIYALNLFLYRCSPHH